jgi:hypothetical protein
MPRFDMRDATFKTIRVRLWKWNIPVKSESFQFMTSSLHPHLEGHK